MADFHPVTKFERFLARWSAWEFYPFWFAVLPILAMWLWFAARARHLFFFANVNPAIPFGGAFGISKMQILKLVPPEYLPKTVFAEAGMTFPQILEALKTAGIGFPMIAKPDIGERGFLIKICPDEAQLGGHLERFPTNFILQELLTEPAEMTVLFHRFPNGGKFGVTSVCVKGFLTVTGDGRSTVSELMKKKARTMLQLPRFQTDFPELLGKIPAAGEEVILEPVGNHSRGTAFLFGNQHIDSQLVSTFEKICCQMEGVHYGRFDLKCASPEALKRGEFKVMELNGVLGEPAHVYDPDYGWWPMHRDYFRHWKIIFDLHRANLRLGHRPTPVREGLRLVRQYFKYKAELTVGQ